MTLIIAAGNADQFIQVSDRRLSVNGRIITDEANKAIVLNCENARLAVGFSGLAKFGTFNTREWILKTLNECAPPEYTAEKIINRFTERISKHFSNDSQLQRVQSKDKRLSIMFTGYLYHHKPPLGALAIVSNFQNIDERRNSQIAYNEFKCYFREEHRPNDGNFANFFYVGTLPPIPQKDSSLLKELVKSKKPASAIVGKLVETIRNISDNQFAYNTIGKQLDSIILPRDRTKEAKSGYHSELVKYESYMPDQVMVISEKLHMNVCNISIRPVDTDHAPPMSGPKLRPKQPCWCGSGKRYKNCHGRIPQKGNTWGLNFKADE